MGCLHMTLDLSVFRYSSKLNHRPEPGLGSSKTGCQEPLCRDAVPSFNPEDFLFHFYGAS